MSTATGVMRLHGIAHEPSAPTLALNGVTVTYNGSTPALENVTLEVEAGQQVAVVGPNGAGKSTLFKVLAGLIRPNAGQVNIFGHGPAGHICIGYVPQRSQVDWHFPATVEDVVMMGRVGQIGLLRRPGRKDWQAVRASLERVRVADLAKKQIGELSGGQQQRVFLARTLAQEAELLLLDEPVAGLDTPSQEAIFEILASLRPDGVTVLLATHDLNLATERFDQVLLLNRRVVAQGRPAAVLTTTNLARAYGGHLHVVSNEDGMVLLTDTCCETTADH